MIQFKANGVKRAKIWGNIVSFVRRHERYNLHHTVGHDVFSEVEKKISTIRKRHAIRTVNGLIRNFEV